jgi:Na+/H+ antiporter NhaC
MNKNTKYIWPSNSDFAKNLNNLGKLFYYTGAGKFIGSIKYSHTTGFKRYFILNWWHPLIWLYAFLNLCISLISGLSIAIGVFFKTFTQTQLIHKDGILLKNPNYIEKDAP